MQHPFFYLLHLCKDFTQQIFGLLNLMDINIIVGNVAPPSGIPAQTQQKKNSSFFVIYCKNIFFVSWDELPYHFSAMRSLTARRNRATAGWLMLVGAWKCSIFGHFLSIYYTHSFQFRRFCFVESRWISEMCNAKEVLSSFFTHQWKLMHAWLWPGWVTKSPWQRCNW